MATITDKLAARLAQAHAALDAPELKPTPTVESVLLTSRRALSNDELARALGCHKGSSSKRVSHLLRLGRVYRVRLGRRVAIGLHSECAPVDLFSPRAAPAPS